MDVATFYVWNNVRGMKLEMATVTGPFETARRPGGSLSKDSGRNGWRRPESNSGHAQSPLRSNIHWHGEFPGSVLYGLRRTDLRLEKRHGRLERKFLRADGILQISPENRSERIKRDALANTTGAQSPDKHTDSYLHGSDEKMQPEWKLTVESSEIHHSLS
ncbi:hypothetical protein E4U54_007220 [Claviceps lovelessii]|nr:hypothetical protein E4U54_007220 [Claviceps lovelessii]